MSEKVRSRETRGRGRPEPASGATARRARAGARRVPLGRGSIGEDVRRRLDGTICGPLATIRAPYPRGWEVAPRATRGPRKNALARDENPLRTRRGNRRSSRVGIELHLASKAIGLGGPGGESHVLCVTLRTGATAENADIGRRLRGASGRLRGTHAWERRGERSVVVVHSEPEKHAVARERSVERDAARPFAAGVGKSAARDRTSRLTCRRESFRAERPRTCSSACVARCDANRSGSRPFTSRVFSSHKGCEKRHAGTRERVLSRFWVRCVSII